MDIPVDKMASFLYAKALEASENGNPEEALELLKNAAALNQASLKLRLEIGILFVKLQSVDEALYHFVKGLEGKVQDDIENYLMLIHNISSCCLLLSDFDTALAIAEIAYKKSPENFHLMRNYSTCLLYVGGEDNYELALAVLERAHQLYPDEDQVVFTLFRAYMSRNNHPKSLEFAHKVVACGAETKDPELFDEASHVIQILGPKYEWTTKPLPPFHYTN